MKIEFTSTKEQAAFHRLNCKYPAFVGGFGSGKSETMCNQAIMDAATSGEALIALYAPTYDLVRLIIAPRLMAKLEKFGIKFDYNKTENLITTHHPQFGNFIMRSLDTPERIVGYESYRAHIDEIDILPELQANTAWNKIVGRNRQVLKNVHRSKQMNRVCAYSTPEGFNFMYNRWVKSPAPGYEMIKAKSISNPMLPDDYIQNLINTYPKELILAYLEGEFVNLTTGTVYKSFDRFKHGSKETVLDGENILVGIDFNVTKMCATIYVKRIEDRLVRNELRSVTTIHAVDEITDMYDTPDLIREINKKFINNKIIAYPDASGRSRKTVGASVSDIALLEAAGYEVRAPRKNPLVKDRVAAVNGAFDRQVLFINVDKCRNVVECLEQQSYDSNGIPDKSKGKDHQNDATGYPICYEMPINKPISVIPVEFVGA